jgi:pimeloyl-ACP methyl ester carboxylesterase
MRFCHIAVIVVVGCSGRPLELDDEGPGPTAVPVECPRTPPAGTTVACYRIEVPASRASPASRDDPNARIQILAARIAARHPTSPPQAPVVFLSGGPGQEGVGTVFALLQANLPFIPNILADRDLIVLDQRGTGDTTPRLRCWQDGAAMPAAVSSGTNVRTLPGLWPRQMPPASCADELRRQGIEPGDYNTLESADDVDDVRRALGLATWNVLGISYGTRLALEVARRHAGSVATVVLDSVLPAEVDAMGTQAVMLYRSMSLVFAACARDPLCAVVYADLEGTLARTANALDGQPLSVVTPTRADAVTGQVLVSLLIAMLYQPISIAEIPEVVYAAERRDPRPLARWTYLLSPGDERSFSTETYLAVSCTEEAPFTTADTITTSQAAVPESLRRYLDATPLFDECRRWRLAPAAAIANQEVTGKIPALVLAGELDPVTPPQWAEASARALAPSHLFVRPNESHGILLGTCGGDLVAPFLRNPSSRPEAPSCASIEELVFRRVGGQPRAWLVR